MASLGEKPFWIAWGNMIKAILAVVALLSAFYGGIIWHNQFALAEDVSKMSQQVKMNRLNYLYQESLNNYYNAKKQAKKYPRDFEAQEEFQSAKEDKDDLKSQILDLKKKMQ